MFQNKLIIMFFCFVLNLNFIKISCQPVPDEITLINNIRRECPTCSTYFDTLQLRNNITARKDEFLSDVNQWITNSDPKVPYFAKDKARNAYTSIVRTVNEIIAQKMNRYSNVSELMTNLQRYIADIDSVLPDLFRFVRNDFYNMMLDLLKTYDDLENITRPSEYDDWVRNITSVGTSRSI